MSHSRLTFDSNRRSAYQERVARLLARIESCSRERRRLETLGALPAALAPIDERLERARTDLAALVTGSARNGRLHDGSDVTYAA
jgi:hypothetical protein